jgi:hypothetical protein
MNINLSKEEIETLLVGLRLITYEMDKIDGLMLFDYDKMTIRDANLNKLYSKISETLYLDDHRINKA